MFEQRIRRLYGLDAATVMKTSPCVAYSPVTVFRRFLPLAVVQSKPILLFLRGRSVVFPIHPSETSS